MVTDLLRALTRKRAEPEAPVETLDLEAIHNRLGEPLPSKATVAGGAHTRADGRKLDGERSWRRRARA